MILYLYGMSGKKEFLQSQNWLAFQKATGREVLPFEEGGFLANGIIHRLPLVGKYVYVPKGPKTSIKYKVSSIKYEMARLIDLAKEKNCRWIRIEPETEEILEAIKKSTLYKVVKAPHDMQPREIFKIDITKTEEELLVQMKSKTRYNIRLAEKRGVQVFATREEKYIVIFLDLITATSGRKGITSHPRSYYEKFFSTLPKEMCQLFVAEYKGEVIAANMMMFYGDTATYLHGGSGDVHRDAMAPYLLQWEQIKRAKALGCSIYDFGGIRTEARFKNQDSKINSWSGITKFKTGFSPETASTVFPGTYDIVLDTQQYFVYRELQSLKQAITFLKKRLF